MENYKIIENLYRIPGGFGASGESFGGYYIQDDTPILIGASGEEKYVANLIKLFEEKKLENIRLYMPFIGWNELITMGIINKKFPEITFYVHEDLYEGVTNPRKNFMQDRFGNFNADAVKKYSKKLPKNIENVVGINKKSSFLAGKTKILAIPFSGPQLGHTLIYSTRDKTLFTGIALGMSTSNKQLYYLDKTGSLDRYQNELEFIKQATANVIAPNYDEVHFTERGPIDIIGIENAMNRDREAIFELITLYPKSIPEIASEYKKLYGYDLNTPPYDEIKLHATIISIYIEELIKDGRVKEQEGKYIRIT